MLEMVGRTVVLLLMGPLLLIGVVAFLVIAAALFPHGQRRVKETFRCPWTGRVVTADFLVSEWMAHPSEVAACTAFPNPERVGCKKPCRAIAEANWGLSRGVFPRWALIADGTVTWRSAAEPASAR